MFKLTLYLVILAILLGCESTNSGSTTESYLSSNDTLDNQNSITQTTVAKSSIPMLAILVSYNNIQITSPISTWSEKIFGKNEGQLNHFYLQASSNNFEFTPVEDKSGYIQKGTVSLS